MEKADPRPGTVVKVKHGTGGGISKTAEGVRSCHRGEKGGLPDIHASAKKCRLKGESDNQAFSAH